MNKQMIREIKFRAISENGNFQYGSYYVGVMYPTSHVGHYVNDIPIDENTLGQFTGLKDAKGIDIYEGDILSVKSFFAEGRQQIENVVFDRGCFWIMKESRENNYSSYAYPDKCWPLFKINTEIFANIIGNIYENPELLK